MATYQEIDTVPVEENHRRYQRWWLWVVFAGVVLLIVAGLVILLRQPATWPVLKVEGVDKWSAHRPFDGEKSVGQKFVVESDTLVSIEVLVVDFKNKSTQAPITLTLWEEGQDEPLRVVEVSGAEVRDDHYLLFAFETISSAAGRAFLFTLTAQAATPEGPYAIRLTDGDALLNAYRLENGVSDEKLDIAFGYNRQVTKFFLLWQWLQRNSSRLITISGALGLSVLTLILIGLNVRRGKRWQVVLLLAVMIGGAGAQFYVISNLHGEPAADAYYILVSTNQIAQGVNPLSYKSYRLPGYAALLLPAMSPHIPDLLWGRLLNVVATIGIVLGLWLIARQLGYSPYVAVLAAVLLFINKEFLITSVRPLAHTVYAGLLMVSIASFFYVKKIRHAVLWGILLGAMSMVRQESFVPIFILGLAYLGRLLYQRTSLKKIILMLLAAGIPLLIFLMPYLRANYIQFGNPLGSPYFSKTEWGLNNPKSIPDFIENSLPNANSSLSYSWRPYLDHRFPLVGWSDEFPYVLGIVIAIYVIWRLPVLKSLKEHLRKWRLPDIVAVLAIVGILVAFYVGLWLKEYDFDVIINLFFLAAMVLGPIELIRGGRWQGLMVVAILVSQILIAAWFNPQPRYFLQAYPLLALGMAVILVPMGALPLKWKEKVSKKLWWRYLLHVTPLVLIISLMGAIVWSYFYLVTDRYNYHAAPFYVPIATAERMQAYDGNVISEMDTTHKTLYNYHSYVQDRIRAFEESDLSNKEQLAWLCEKEANYLLDNDDLDYFTLHLDDQYRDAFTYMFETSSMGKNDRLYRMVAYEFSDPMICEALLE